MIRWQPTSDRATKELLLTADGVPARITRTHTTLDPLNDSKGYLLRVYMGRTPHPMHSATVVNTTDADFFASCVIAAMPACESLASQASAVHTTDNTAVQGQAGGAGR